MAERKPLSVSQYNSFKQCPQRWFLTKVEKHWSRPAAWLPQGSAFHAAIEGYEKSGRSWPLERVQDEFREQYALEVGKYTAITPNFEYWFKSGPYDGEVDTERRYNIGLEQVAKYVAWAEKNCPAIWVTEDGTPGIELGFELDLPSGTPIRGFIDQIVIDDGLDTVVRDLKTGNQPGDDFQLATYAVAVNALHDTVITKGDYWMAKSGKPTYPYDLTDWPLARIDEEFSWLEQEIAAGNFDAKPDEKACRFCDVNHSCEYRYAE